MKPFLKSNVEENPFFSSWWHPSFTHMLAASFGEVAACLVRVPTEVVKTKMMTSETKLRLGDTVRAVLQEQHGVPAPLAMLTGGMYRGFGMTLFREIPFAMIQFPLYEMFKVQWSLQLLDGAPLNPIQAATCGSIAGAFAAGLTTPLDVLKTRIMVRMRAGFPLVV